MMKALGARFSRVGRNFSTNNYGESNKEERDLRFILDKGKLTRMSKDERIRELLRQHGGKNVSSAIKFLATELEKQKQSLLENISHTEGVICSCRCHNTDSLKNINHDGEQDFSVEHPINSDSSTSDEHKIEN